LLLVVRPLWELLWHGQHEQVIPRRVLPTVRTVNAPSGVGIVVGGTAAVGMVVAGRVLSLVLVVRLLWEWLWHRPVMLRRINDPPTKALMTHINNFTKK
jgi:hypothetical protein